MLGTDSWLAVCKANALFGLDLDYIDVLEFIDDARALTFSIKDKFLQLGVKSGQRLEQAGVERGAGEVGQEPTSSI